MAKKKAAVTKTVTRRKPAAQPGNAVKGSPNDPDVDRYTRELPKNQFNNVIRMIKTRGIDRAQTLRQCTFDVMRELGVKQNLTKKVKGVPNGSDHADIQTLVTWMRNVKKTDTKAIAQIVAIDATCCARVE